MKFYYILLSTPIIDKITQKIIIKIEGKKSESKLLRNYCRDKRNIAAGMYSYGGFFNKTFKRDGKVIIGKYCSINRNCQYIDANHPHNEAVMSPYFYEKSFGLDVEQMEKGTLEIGNDVWIGTNVVILPSCKKIGNGAVIGAGAIVTRDVEPYSIVVGVPAKHLRYRFDKETIKFLEKSEWWELPPKELYKYYEYRKEPKKFAKEIIKAKQ